MSGVGTSIGDTEADPLSDQAVAAEIRRERRRLFDRQRLTGPFGVFVASCAFVALSADHLASDVRSAWFAAMTAVTVSMASTFRGPLARRTSSDGVPVLSHVAHTATGLGWGLTVWLDLDATRDGPVVWIALTMIVAVIAGASAGISGSSALGRNLILAASATTSTGLIVAGHIVTGAAFVVFVAVLLAEMDDARQTWEDLVELRLVSNVEADRNRDAAMHDALTSSLNRSGMRSRFDTDVAGRPCAALYLDLDGFKEINDEHGHRTGDLVLAEVARRIRTALPDSALVARVGGDEFVVVASTVDLPELGHVRASLHEAIERPMTMPGDTDVVVTASIGTAMCAHGGVDLDDLLDRADHDQYRVKRSGSTVDGDSAIA